MTGYHISFGYNSGYSNVDAEISAAMVRHADAIRKDSARLIAELRRVDPRAGIWNDEVLCEYAEAYATGADLTINVGSETVSQMASGIGESRIIKEAFRRAFCRLLIEDMHRLGIEVNLVVS